MKNVRIVGTSVPRVEGRDKVTGQARYVDDMVLPDMLYGATVRSRIPRGKIKKITFGPGIEWSEFVIVSPEDIPGKNCIALIEEDQPCLADRMVNHPEEPLLLLGHPIATSSQKPLRRFQWNTIPFLPYSAWKKVRGSPKSSGARTIHLRPI